MASRALLRFTATTGPTATVSSSADFPGDAGYTTYPAPPISRRDEDGFSSCTAHPCHRATPTTPPERIDASVRIRRPILPSSRTRRLGLRIFSCRGHLWVHLHCGPVTRSPSRGWLCQSASEHLVSLLSATQATGLLTPALVGLTPTECASLRLDALLRGKSICVDGRGIRDTGPRRTKLERGDFGGRGVLRTRDTQGRRAQNALRPVRVRFDRGAGGRWTEDSTSGRESIVVLHAAKHR